jgi:hypothetical protein
MRMTPVVLDIITNEIKNESSTVSGRYTVRAKVISPERFYEKEIFLVLDGVPPHCDFLKIDEQWTIDFDQSSFHSIEYAGLSFWKYSDLNPRKTNSNRVAESINSLGPHTTQRADPH